MKEKPVFFGSPDWTIRKELISAVEGATSDACWAGSFVRSNIIIDEATGTASFAVHKASHKGYRRFRSTMVTADKKLREEEHAAAVDETKYPMEKSL